MKTDTILLLAASLVVLVACNNGATATPNEPTAEPAMAGGDHQDDGMAQAPSSMPHAGHDDHAGHGDDHAPPADEHADDGHTDHDHGGGGEMDNVLEEGEYDPAELVAQPGAAVGDITTCPVSGEMFRVTDDSPFVDHEGADVYFCCARCIRRFQRDPDTYLGAGAAAPAHGGMVEVSAEGTRFDPAVEKSMVPTGTWICDMGTVHYASTEHGDGRCPVCGMRLVEH